MTRPGLGLFAAACVLGVSLAGAVEREPLRVERGRAVAIEYTLLLADGFIVETNIGGEPFEYVHGDGALLPRLAKALEGLTVGQQTMVTLMPAHAYGRRNARAQREVPIDAVPYDARLVGAPFAVAGYDWPVLVREVRPDAVVLDLNHPLAGRTLTFRIRIVAIH